MDSPTIVPTWMLSLMLGSFFFVVLSLVVCSLSMFSGRYGRRHRVVGLTYLFWLVGGFVDLHFQHFPCIIYDVVLGILGTLLALSAAFDFKVAHARVQNSASGTLEESATVTYSEMIEHSFYQGLNLIQVVYLHSMKGAPSAPCRCVLAMLVTAPWWFRSRFPINKFSDNYVKNDPLLHVSILYRLKKYQYLLFKHFLLHGLNVSVAVDSLDIASQTHFRWYWIALNTAYVMEFFLQTLVKKKYMAQSTMLRLQQLLMFASTLATLPILLQVRVLAASLSLLLNFVHRHHEICNTMLVLCVVWMYTLM